MHTCIQIRSVSKSPSRLWCSWHLQLQFVSGNLVPICHINNKKKLCNYPCSVETYVTHVTHCPPALWSHIFLLLKAKTAQNILCLQSAFAWLCLTVSKFFEKLPVGMGKEWQDHIEESSSHESLLAEWFKKAVWTGFLYPSSAPYLSSPVHSSGPQLTFLYLLQDENREGSRASRGGCCGALISNLI